MRKINLTLMMLFIFTITSFSQPWIVNNSKSNPNFNEISESYYNYVDKNDIPTKMKKKFKRWESFYIDQVDENGKIPMKTYWEEIEKINKSKKQSKGLSNWIAMGPQNIPLELTTGYRMGVGRINCIEFHPSDPNTFWVGTPVGGVWKTTDNGETWTTTTDDLPSIGISDIVVNPTNPDIIYIATGDRDAQDIFSVGVLKSVDGGETWNLTGLSFEMSEQLNVNEIIMNPDDTNILIAATSIGIYKTTDGGENWILVSEIDDFKDIQYKLDDFNIILASTYGFYSGNNKIFRSTNGGDSFDILTSMNSELSDASRIAFATTPAATNIFYALSCTSSTTSLEGLYKSTDSGATWTKLTDETTPDIIGYYFPPLQGFGQSWYNLTLSVSPLDPNDILIGGVHFWKSEDGGLNFELTNDGWTTTETWVHADMHELRYNPLNDELYVTNDGGVYVSDDYGNEWEDISYGLQILQSYRISVSPTVEDYVVMGNQDNGAMRIKDGECVSTHFGDGMECIIDYNSPNIIYSSVQGGDFYKSTNYGYSWYPISPSGQSGTGAWTTPLTMNPNNSEILYAGYNALWKTENGGSSWTKISNNFSGQLQRVAVAKTDDNVICVSNANNIWKTSNGGETWSTIKNNLPGQFVNDICISPVDKDKIWAVFGEYMSENKVFVSENGGFTWENITKNLPNLPIRCIHYENNSADGIYVGTFNGVYYINNSMEEWVYFSANLPNSIVNDIEIQDEFNTITIGTYGRGVWKSNTFYSDDDIPVVDFSYENIGNCSGEVHFQNKTTAYFDEVIWNFGDENISIELNPNHTFLSEGTYIVELTVVKDEIEYSKTIEIEIGEVIQNPVVEDAIVCGTNSVTLTAQGSDNIYWYDSPTGENLLYTGEEYQTPILYGSTSYFVANGISEACHSSLVEVFIEMKASPNAMFFYQTNELTVNFNNTSTNSSEYLWNFGDGNQSEEQNPSHTYEQAGVYDVQLTAYNEFCEKSIEKTIDLATEIEFIDFEDFNIYPNPSDGNFSISFTNNEINTFNISITDIKGSIIFNEKFENYSGYFSKTFDISDVSKGIYFINIEKEKYVKTIKIVVE